MTVRYAVLSIQYFAAIALEVSDVVPAVQATALRNPFGLSGTCSISHCLFQLPWIIASAELRRHV